MKAGGRGRALDEKHERRSRRGRRRRGGGEGEERRWGVRARRQCSAEAQTGAPGPRPRAPPEGATRGRAFTSGAPPTEKLVNINYRHMVGIPDIKLVRTDTTLDLSQSAEKGMPEPGARSPPEPRGPRPGGRPRSRGGAKLEGGQSIEATRLQTLPHVNPSKLSTCLSQTVR